MGNPPFLGGSSVSTHYGVAYRDWLKEIHPESHGNADLVAHFFRRSFHLLRGSGTFGLIATNTIGQGDTRSTGLRFICRSGGQIYRAFTRYKWLGQAAVVVSIVHVTKSGRSPSPRPPGEPVASDDPRALRCVLDGQPVHRITAFLFHGGGHDDPARLAENVGLSFMGSKIYGPGFIFDDAGRTAGGEPESGADEGADVVGVPSPLSEMERLCAANPKNRDAIFPYLGGAELNTSPTHAHHRYVINFRDYPLRRRGVETAAPGGGVTAADAPESSPLRGALS